MIQKAISYTLNTKKEQISSYTINQVMIGAMFTAVRLSSGYCGIAKTELNHTIQHGRKGNESPFVAGKIAGSNILDLLSYDKDENFIDIVKLATLNALSAEIIEKGNYKILENKDPLDLIEPHGKQIAMVGAFCSYIQRLSEINCKLQVLELDENAFNSENKKYYIPASESAKVFANSDIAIITGSALANKTMDGLLNEIPAKTQIIVVGPTSGIYPELFFERNVSVIGATRVTNPDKMFQMIAEGAAGYQLFRSGAAQKICILNEKK